MRRRWCRRSPGTAGILDQLGLIISHPLSILWMNPVPLLLLLLTLSFLGDLITPSVESMSEASSPSTSSFLVPFVPGTINLLAFPWNIQVMAVVEHLGIEILSFLSFTKLPLPPWRLNSPGWRILHSPD